MAKFSKNNLFLVIKEIEGMEDAKENIWVPIGILEIMYDDYSGIIDNYFHTEKLKRNFDDLYKQLNNHLYVSSHSNYVLLNDQKNDYSLKLNSVLGGFTANWTDADALQEQKVTKIEEQKIPKAIWT